MNNENLSFSSHKPDTADRAVRHKAAGRFAGFAIVLATVALLPAPFAGAEEQHVHHHDHHHHAEPAKVLTRTEVNYAVPGIPVIRMDGTRANLTKDLDSGRPVILNFIYTSCTAICPMTSQVFSRLQDRLSGQGERVSLVSISIDPEYDTPSRLAAYAKQFGAGPGWQFYTGTVKDSIAIQKAFDVFRGDKMNHIPVTFLRPAPGKPWVRIEGMASSEDLLDAYKRLNTGAQVSMR